MKKTEIIETLKTRYEVAENVSIKNGIEIPQIIVRVGIVSPSINLETLEKCENENSLFEIVENAISSAPQLNVNDFLNKESILKNAKICLQKPGNENIVKRDFLDLEMYIRIFINSEMSFKLTKEILEKVDISENEIFQNATNNTFSDSVSSDFWGMTYITNNEKNFGASVIATDFLKTYCQENELEKIYILPSSIHECIVLPYEKSIDTEMLNNMICEVNENEVAPHEILSNHYYLYDFSSNTITF